MNLIKFIYDLFVWLTCNYSQLPSDFKEKFPEVNLVLARLSFSEFVQDDSNFNQEFKDYE